MSQQDETSSVSWSRKSEKQKQSQARRKVGPRHELTTEQKADLKLAFDSFDTNGTGWIGIEELRVAIRALGYEPKMEQMSKMVAEIDRDGKGKISFNDFLHLMAIKMSQKDTKEEIMKAFRLIDISGSGQIKFQDLKRVAVELGEYLNDEELHEMIEEADSNQDGIVTFEDFLKINKKYDGFQVEANSRQN
ncbi:uncharacterized protein LOC129913451 [Episyrphus balteatus]|uniref:uncharacterized protein LOC129913451 n=1 Tax=Episyrphus balteatus TaxID=286459 RepID=UPI002486AD79|nr:uncharacterized protein LOC129913451 [Episyrphus balteatus]